MLLVRRISGRRADQIVLIILANLGQVIEDLDRGTIAVLGEDWIYGFGRCPSSAVDG